MKIKTRFTLLAAWALMLTVAARADQFTVSLNTSSLSGTQTLAFALTDGDGVAGNNTATLSGFSFGGGSAVAGTEDCTLGGTLSGAGCSGNLTTGVTLTDNDFTAFFTEQFNAGSSISFTLITTDNFSGSGFPDQFAMYVCDAGFANCYSDDQNTAAMLTVDLTGEPLDFTLNGASDQNLPAPVVTAAVPEPADVLLLASGLLCLIPVRRRAISGTRRRDPVS